ncbi:DNA cytosine methyltransferase [Nocardia seriolae]|uniref:DNA cytosine methyltransferase n=1 Tax=Nocardia seriolae TaxID=37332 RepID=UPI0005ED5922|nr:DNA (cytosine-5-)-methyltransferase [Nocardia seriolae]WKY50863.1 DNA (cytosine-5-)-methyltransferase [Nocardia seriolae]WNJ57507.1 DNA (cytosine-5-)-methyltransferase [Nocardia seriolae]
MTRTSKPDNASAKPGKPQFTSIEICAGAGGQAVGLHQAGFGHLALVEIDEHAVATLNLNIKGDNADPAWAWEGDNCRIISKDVKAFEPLAEVSKNGKKLAPRELDLLAGGVPCPPFSHAGKQLGRDDERDLFPRMLELVKILQPRAVMIENVRGIMDPKFEPYRTWIRARLEGGKYTEDDGQIVGEPGLGYTVCNWGVLEASNFGVPQLRPRAILVAIRNDVLGDLPYSWPTATHEESASVADSLAETMRERYARFDKETGRTEGRAQFDRWYNTASSRHTELKGRGGGIAPTLVGGSKKHGGADLGPSRAKAAWKQLGVSGMGVANDLDTCTQKNTYERDLFGPDGPMLTVQQTAIIQGFPADWKFSGGKTAQYRQIGNAFPPPVAKAVGDSIAKVLSEADKRDRKAKREQERKERLRAAKEHSEQYGLFATTELAS